MDTNVAFLACMDEDDTTAEKAAKSCSSASSITFSDVKDCFDGSRGDDLLKQASDIWNKAVPGRGYIPKVIVNGNDDGQDKSKIISDICNDSKSSSPACSRMDSAVFKFCAA